MARRGQAPPWQKTIRFFGLSLVVEQRPAGASPAVRDWCVLRTYFCDACEAALELAVANLEFRRLA